MPTSIFTDLTGDEWFYGDAVACYNFGLIKGYPGKTFFPPYVKPELRDVYARQAVLASRIVQNDLVWRGYTTKRLREQAIPAVVSIGTKGSVGSGVVLTPDGYIVSCHHVVQDYFESQKSGETNEIKASWFGGSRARSTLTLKVVAELPEQDLVLLKADVSEPLPYLKLENRAEPGEPVVILGTPSGVPGWESHGLVARPEVLINYYAGPQLVTPVSAAVNPGNSGGALIRASDGALVGVVSAKLVDVTIEGMAFAIPGGVVRNLCEKNGVTLPDA